MPMLHYMKDLIILISSHTDTLGVLGYWLIGDQRPDVVMFNEIKLTSKLYLDGYYSHQTLLKRSGGCITFSNFKSHSRVKALGIYLNWTKVSLKCEEIHILNVYLEPGHEK